MPYDFDIDEYKKRFTDCHKMTTSDSFNYLYNTIVHQKHYVILTTRRYLPVIMRIIETYYSDSIDALNSYRIAIPSSGDGIFAILHKKYMGISELNEFFDTNINSNAAVVAMVKHDDIESLEIVTDIIEQLISFISDISQKSRDYDRNLV